MTQPIITYTIEVDADGNITNDTQCHGSSFAQVYRAFHVIRQEVDRQIVQRRECPFNPMHGVDPVFDDEFVEAMRA